MAKMRQEWCKFIFADHVVRRYAIYSDVKAGGEEGIMWSLSPLTAVKQV